jgi:hypothetical protein
VGSRVGLVICSGDQTTDPGGMANLAHRIRRVTVTAPAENVHRLRAADTIATFELYIVSSTGGGRSIHVAKGLRSR